MAFTVSSPQKSVLRIKLLNTMMRARLEVPDLHHKPPRRDHASFAALVYNENYNNDTSNETKHETNYSINNKCNDMNTRNMHIT